MCELQTCTPSKLYFVEYADAQLLLQECNLDHLDVLVPALQRVSDPHFPD